jgi:hypothetical protein
VLRGKCPRPESNQCTRFRKPLLYPLSYGGFGSHRPFARAECSPTVTLGLRAHGEPRWDVNRSTGVGAGREHATGADSGAASYGVFARSETQCLNVPYFVLKAGTPAFRSVTHILPAATVACCCACDLADAFVETHLPYASAVEP